MRNSLLALIVVLVSLMAFSEALVQATEIQTGDLTSFGDSAGASGGYASYFGSGAGSLNTSGLGNSYFGWGTGYSNTTGNDNSFFGAGAGYNNTASSNSFFGQNAGNANTTGSNNSFFGRWAGISNTTGSHNSFVGNAAGDANTEGYENTFFGSITGFSNTMGSQNSFIGSAAGYANIEGFQNSFLGYAAGYSNTTGSQNSFVGSAAGQSNTAGYENSFLGYAAGYSNTTGSHNSLVGNGAGYANTEGIENSFFGYAAGSYNTTGNNGSFVGNFAGHANTTASGNSFMGSFAGLYSSAGQFNSFFGYGAGGSNTIENNNSFFGTLSDGAAGITNSTAIGYRAKVTRSDSLVLGGVNGVNGATAETNIGIGITNPDRQLTVEGTQAVGRLRRYYGTTDPFTRTFAPTFLLERSRGNQAVPVNIQAGDYLGKVQFRGVVGGSAVEYGAMAFVASDTSQNGRFAFIDRDLTTERMSILNTGNVGINTTAPLERLHVVGNVRIDGDLIWTDPGASVPDYVFHPDYRLMGIDALEKFITEEKHLPNIPAAVEIRDKGLNVNDFQMKLLEKIEELTLYTVQQAKAIEEQKAALDQKDTTIATLQAHNAALDARVTAIEQVMERLAMKEK
jgi:trimeric autotransporter adhesin